MARNRGVSGLLGVSLAAGMCWAFVACVPLPADTPPTTPPPVAPAPQPSATPEDERAPVPMGIPECAGVLTDAQAKEIFTSDFAPWTGPGAEATESTMRRVLGPAAYGARSSALELRQCYWAIPLSDVIESMFVAELNTASRKQLLSELRSSDYEESSSDGIALFTYTTRADGWTSTNWYGFVGDVWVASFGQRGQLPIERAFENLRAANPEWNAATG